MITGLKDLRGLHVEKERGIRKHMKFSQAISCPFRWSNPRDAYGQELGIWYLVLGISIITFAAINLID